MSTPRPSLAELQAKEFLVACLCADWCDTCRDYQDSFLQLAVRFPQAAFLWVDIEDEAELVDDYEVENFPTLLIQRSDVVLFYGVIAPPYARQAQRLIEELTAQTPEQSRTYAAATPERRQWQTTRNLQARLAAGK